MQKDARCSQNKWAIDGEDQEAEQAEGWAAVDNEQ